MDNSKYYFIRRKGDKAYPIISLLNLGHVEFHGGILNATLNPPIPRSPVMADYLQSGKDVLSNRVVEIMKGLNMEGVQFFQMDIDNNEDYTCVSVDKNTYELLDKEKSIFEHEDVLYEMEKLVIDRIKLNDIPLSKRLGMRLREAPGYYLYHQTVVDAVMALEPTGMIFQDIEEYGFY